MSVNPSQLAETLRGAGLAGGDSVLVHSSFRSLLPFAGGPAEVIAAIRAIIGEDGNLMLPTFNYTRPLPEPHFDVHETAARTGAIAETGRAMRGAVRSLHPTHSVAVIGPDAEALTRDHLDSRAFGVDSPIDRFARQGGNVLLLGVGHTANSTLHLAEEHAGIAKVSSYDPLPWVKVRLPDGSMIEHQIDSSPSCSAAFEAAAYLLRRDGLIRDARAGGCLIQIMRAQDVIDCIAARLRKDPDLLRCTDPNCILCTGARRR